VEEDRGAMLHLAEVRHDRVTRSGRADWDGRRC